MAFQCFRRTKKSWCSLPTVTARSRATPTFLLRIGWNEIAQKPSLAGKERKESEMAVKPIPEGYHSVTPYLIIMGAAEAIGFYKKAFGAVELFRFPSPDGKVGHAEIKIGDSPIMLADEYPPMGYKGPQSIGGSPVSLMIYVEDVAMEEMVRRAKAAHGS